MEDTFSAFPQDTSQTLHWNWDEFQPYFDDLIKRQVTETNIKEWLADWTRITCLLQETHARLYIATTLDTTDQGVSQNYYTYLEQIYPKFLTAEQILKEKMLSSGHQLSSFEIPLRNLLSQADLFREANLPLITQEEKLCSEYDKIISVQTVTWEGEELMLDQLDPLLQDPERNKRERAWRLAMTRRLRDRHTINDLWVKSLELRGKIAANAGKSDFRSYIWQKRLRFDYTKDDCETFHDAIEKVVVPAVERLNERRRRSLGLSTLCPWDLDVDTLERPPLRPFTHTEDLEYKGAEIFHQVDRELGAQFDILRSEKLLDLDNRKGKAPGGYCYPLLFMRRPFIFMNSVGIHDNVQTLLHEAGHAFHIFHILGNTDIPYVQQWEEPTEFAEVASMAMELLASPYLVREKGGFYNKSDAARGLIEHLEGILRFWPYMAVVDAFQHWVYANPYAATDPGNCDAKWDQLWQRFMPAVDWDGVQDEKETGWQRKHHIHQQPFYYIEYGLAQLGAVQIWRNAFQDRRGSLRAYREALSLGGSVPLPDLFAAAGAHFAFDAYTLQQAVDFIESKLAELGQYNT